MIPLSLSLTLSLLKTSRLHKKIDIMSNPKQRMMLAYDFNWCCYLALILAGLLNCSLTTGIVFTLFKRLISNMLIVLLLKCCVLTCLVCFAVFASWVLPLNEQQFLKILKSVRNCWHAVWVSQENFGVHGSSSVRILLFKVVYLFIWTTINIWQYYFTIL